MADADNGPTPIRGDPSVRARFLDLAERLVANVMSMRKDAFSGLFDPRRDVEQECGYPQLSETIKLEAYAQMWDRDPIAARVVEVMPKESWQVMPQIYEAEEGEEPTAFDQSLKALAESLQGDNCYYASEDGSPVFLEPLMRGDILSGIGHHGAVLLGLDDGRKLNTPAEFRKDQKLLFLSVFPEHQALILNRETNQNSRRFGHPTSYNVTFNDPREDIVGGGLSAGTQEVHWSRIIHLADVGHQASSNVFQAPPRMRCVWNNLQGLHKIYAADPEAYWKNCLTRFFLTTHPQLGGDVDIDINQLRNELEPFMNGLQPFFTLMGMTATPIAPTVVDPTPHINTQLEAICIKLGCPVRIFKGSERGELASTQDDDAWNDRLRFRQMYYITPRIIVPFLDRLIYLGVLAPPQRTVGNVKQAATVTKASGQRVQVINEKKIRRGYSIFWPDLTSRSDQEKATVAGLKTTALASYVGGNVESVVPPYEFLTMVLDFDPAEAEAMLTASAEAVAGSDPVQPVAEATEDKHETSAAEAEKNGDGSFAVPDTELSSEMKEVTDSIAEIRRRRLKEMQ